MKKIILAATALASVVALSSTARAADVIVSGYDWTGFYLGANAGMAWNNTEIDNEIDYNGTDPLLADRLEDLGNDLTGDQTAFTAGALLGYNWQMDQIVLGVEADINYLGFSGDEDAEFNDILGNQSGLSATHDLSFEADWFGTLRGRLGFAFDNVLLYGTGGLAYGHMEADSDFRVYDSAGDELGKWDGSADSVNWGWTIGAGMEYGIENWSLGLEYLYVDLGSAEWDSNGDENAVINQLDDASSDASVDYQFSVVRATAKLRF